MTTSGSRDFNLDVGEIIEEAYERCGLEVRTGYDAKTARRSMNLMFADFVGYDDAVVWRDYLTQFMTVDEALGYKIRPVTITLEED